MFITACSVSLVKEEKYISTKPFQDDAYKFCMGSTKYKKERQQNRQSICEKEAQALIATAEKKFRDYKADEHNYRLCRSKFANIEVSDKCFREQQEKYYRRELASYKAKLN